VSVFLLQHSGGAVHAESSEERDTESQRTMILEGALIGQIRGGDRLVCKGGVMAEGQHQGQDCGQASEDDDRLEPWLLRDTKPRSTKGRMPVYKVCWGMLQGNVARPTRTGPHNFRKTEAGAG